MEGIYMKKSRVIAIIMLLVTVILVIYLNLTKEQDNTPEKLNAADIIEQLTTNPSATVKSEPEIEPETENTNNEAEEYWVYYAQSTKEVVSAAVFSHEESLFFLSLTKARLDEIQSTFQHDIMLTTQEIGLMDASEGYPDLTFQVDRISLQRIISEVEQNDEINSVFLIKRIPREVTEYSGTIPAGKYYVEAFFNANTVSQIYQDLIASQNGTGCYLYQHTDITGKTMGVYFIDNEQIMLMHDLFQSNPDAKCVNFGTWLRILTSDEISL